MITTYLVCSKCGRLEEYHKAKSDKWLIASHKRKSGLLIIRCPNCITDYAKRNAG